MEVVILAAGMGTRFGTIEPKSLSPIYNQSAIRRLISQTETHLPGATIKVVVGHNAATVEDHLAGRNVRFIHNPKYKKDKNIQSAIFGVAGSSAGVLIIEADCVYDNLAFKEMASSLSRRSILFLGGRAKMEKTNGIVKVTRGCFDEFCIGPRQTSVEKRYFDMAGALWIAPKDLPLYQKEAKAMAKKNSDQYYFEPIFNKRRFQLTCVNLSGKRYTFNTPTEYQAMLDSLTAVDYFPVSELKHIEGFSEKRVLWLKKKIASEKVWTRPVCIDPSGLVMDGQHRMEASKMFGFKKIPVIVFDYEDVEVWSLRKKHEVSAVLIRERIEKNDIYPYKTVKHKFPVPIKDCQIDLDSLYGR